MYAENFSSNGPAVRHTLQFTTLVFPLVSTEVRLGH